MVLENLTIGLQNMVLLEESALRVQGWKEGDTQIHDVRDRRPCACRDERDEEVATIFGVVVCPAHAGMKGLT